MTTDIMLDSPDRIAAEGERIYAERHQQNLEQEHLGHFVAVDVLTGEAYVAEYPEGALTKARAEAPHGVFHLIRIGSPAAFKVSYGSANRDGVWGWALR